MLLALALAASVAAPGFFEDAELAAALGELDAQPGAWAEYLVRSRKRGDARVRVTALHAAGGGRYWLEISSASASGIAAAVRLQLHGGGRSLADVERMYVMLAGQQPVEIPLDRLPRTARNNGRPPEVKRLGVARVRVLAGEFAAEMLRVSGTRVWRAAGVPLWGLVRARSRERDVELVACGPSGGHSVFPAGWDQGKGSESAK